MPEEKDLIDLEMSFEELKSLPIVEYIVLPINSDIEKYKDEIEKKIKFPCWIKLNTGEHKTKMQAVESCSNSQDLQEKYKQLQKKFPDKKFIIQKNINGIEIIVGLKQDRVFSSVLLIGSGGLFTELTKDITFRILPVDKEEIEKALKQLKIYKILKEKNYNIKSLITIIKKFSDLELKEADLNPIIVNEKESIVVDARVSI